MMYKFFFQTFSGSLTEEGRGSAAPGYLAPPEPPSPLTKTQIGALTRDHDGQDGSSGNIAGISRVSESSTSARSVPRPQISSWCTWAAPSSHPPILISPPSQFGDSLINDLTTVTGNKKKMPRVRVYSLFLLRGKKKLFKISIFKRKVRLRARVVK